VNIDDNTALYERLIAKNGDSMQLDIAVEELSELTKEIIKYKRGKGDLIGIAEEIVDVLIMIDQVKMICNVREEDIERWRKCKIEYIREMAADC
jgi:NTP pyrophosphatase (non-canonical NTP hydrolase)